MGGFDASVATQTLPFVHRVSPAAAQGGDSITLFGFGFSTEPGNNIIHVEGTTTRAATYALVDPPAEGEIEKLTFTLPAGTSAGSASVFVTVFDFTSNTDVSFTIDP